MAAKLTERMGKSVVVENRAGASGNIGAEIVVHSAPDGYTLLSTSSTYGIQASLGKTSFDPLNDVTPIVGLARAPAVYELAGMLGTVEDYAKVGRIDMFVDFVTNVDLEGWDRTAWVTRASAINSYSIDGVFSGWAIGLGGAIAARLYDKTLELKVSHKDYLKGLWSQAGWDGEAHVWRLEFQLKRETLSQLGLKDFELVMDNLGGIWSYAMTQWLKLTLPNPDDQTRSRWPVHPLWAALASVDWETSGGPLLRSYAKHEAPSEEWLFNAGLRSVVSWMAKEGITDLDTGLNLFRERMVSFHENQAHQLGLNFSPYIREKLQIKVREYGTGYNLDEIPDDARQRDTDATAVDYRRSSDGFNPHAAPDQKRKANKK